ncbi:MAG: hypothetical protein R3E76_11315 [Planctomycetota bacterium]
MANFLSLAVICFALSACGGGNGADPNTTDSEGGSASGFRLIVRTVEDVDKGPAQITDLVVETGDTSVLNYALSKYPQLEDLKLWAGEYVGEEDELHRLYGELKQHVRLEILGSVVSRKALMTLLSPVRLELIELICCTVYRPSDGTPEQLSPADRDSLDLQIVSASEEFYTEIMNLYQGSSVGTLGIVVSKWFDDSKLCTISSFGNVRQLTLANTAVRFRDIGSVPEYRLRGLTDLTLWAVTFGSDVSISNDSMPDLCNIVLKNCVLSDSFARAIAEHKEIRKLEGSDGTVFSKSVKDILLSRDPPIIID